MTTAAFKLNNVTYRTADGHTLVDSVNLRLFPGEILSIAGPNGAGKTTLLKLMSGLLKPSSGEIYFSNTLLSSMKGSDLARKIAVISQTEEPDPRLTVREYISLGTIPHEHRVASEKREQGVDEILDLLGLRVLASKMINALSGGERQRTYIARSICQKPEVLFLDEPTNHLDPKAKGEVLSIVASLGITTITVLHELFLIPSFSTKVAILNNAKLFAFGAPSKTLSSDTVRSVFGVDMFHFRHQFEDRDISCLDIPVTANRQ